MSEHVFKTVSDSRVQALNGFSENAINCYTAFGVILHGRLCTKKQSRRLADGISERIHLYLLMIKSVGLLIIIEIFLFIQNKKTNLNKIIKEFSTSQLGQYQPGVRPI
ncbi:hypothetical protein [Desulfonema ishimotonii]|uniref:hypothetical protein n=1 Tax=Desulfonema ishimotonii TaxID=45657 RepID=UPI000F564722|nr:hypothetical protein [Desulfonema ishimotonii]